MQDTTFKYPITSRQRVFVESGLEMLYKDTIDSYRLRLNNPKTAIEELVQVSTDQLNGVLNNSDYVKAVSLELKRLLTDHCIGLDFTLVNQKYYTELIRNTKLENLNRIIQASNIILRDSKNYLVNITQKIEEIFHSTDVFENPSDELKSLSIYSQYLCVELVNIGYTKQYLYIFFRAIFVHVGNVNFTFSDRFDEWKKLTERNPETYDVIFKILGDAFQFETLLKIDSSYVKANRKFRAIAPADLSDKVTKYLEDGKTSNLISLKVSAYDHFKAVELARAKLATDLDLYHLGFSNRVFKIDQQAAVIGEIDPSKSSTLPSNYEIDGFTRSSSYVLDQLLSKVKLLRENKVQKESINKIISALRYLRTGSEANELETKLLNYWIGLEYIFTSFKDQEKTIDRMRKYFPVCHSLIYVKRNLYDFHMALGRLKLSHAIPNYNRNLEYLTHYKTYDLISKQSENQLLKFRSTYFQKWVSDPDNISRALQKHKENLDWNLTRLYRIRNEIVHNAAVKNGIYSNVSHIKYYLTFILNSLLDFLSTIPADINNDGQVTIEDYFIAQDIILGSLNGKTITDYNRIDNPFELIH